MAVFLVQNKPIISLGQHCIATKNDFLKNILCNVQVLNGTPGEKNAGPTRAAEGGGFVGGGCGHRQLPRTRLGSFPSQVAEARLDNLCLPANLCTVKYHPGY